MHLVMFVEQEKWDFLDGMWESNPELASKISKEKSLEGLINMKLSVENIWDLSVRFWYDYDGIQAHKHWWQRCVDENRHLFCTDLSIRIDNEFNDEGLKSTVEEYDLLHDDNYKTFSLSPKLCEHLISLDFDDEEDMSKVREALSKIDRAKYKTDLIV